MATDIEKVRVGVEHPNAEIENKHLFGDETKVEETAREAAERGRLATDMYGVSLVKFDPIAEAKLRLKIDLMIVPTVSLLYFCAFIDRASIGNAKLAGLSKDLGLVGYGYNIILSLFYISYILFEIPSNIVCKKMGPGWFLPTISLGFGICSLSTAFCRTQKSISAVRFLLGMFEAGMLPGISYYLSRWYRRSELVWRLGIYISAAPLAGAFGGLLASGILKLDHFGSLRSWRMIFAIEGIITIVIALISFLTLTDRPATAIWLTQDEKDLAIARVKSERVATSEVLDKIDWPKILRGIFNPVTLATAWVFFLNNITVNGLIFFAPTIVVVFQQLKTVPPYIAGACGSLLLQYLSSRTDRRVFFLIISAPPVMIGYIMYLASSNPHVRYGGSIILTTGAFAAGAFSNAIVAANVVSDTSRAAAISTNVVIGNMGGLVATWSFLPFDAPNYKIGNGLNVATSTTYLLSLIALLFWMKWSNKRRERVDVNAALAGMNLKQIQDLDWKHPAFRWRP